MARTPLGRARARGGGGCRQRSRQRAWCPRGAGGAGRPAAAVTNAREGGGFDSASLLPQLRTVGVQGGCRQARSLASWGRAVRGAFPPGLPGFGRRHGPRLPAPPPSAEPAAQPPCACPVATAALWSPHPRLRVPLSRTPGLRLVPPRGPGEKPHLEVPTLITAAESLLRKVASSQVLGVGRGPLGASLHPP